MSEKIPVRFVKPWRSFFKDDVAGFSKGLADELVDGGVAEHVSDGSTSAVPGARKGGRQPRSSAAAPTSPAATQEPTPPAGEAGEGSDSDDEERP